MSKLSIFILIHILREALFRLVRFGLSLHNHLLFFFYLRLTVLAFTYLRRIYLKFQIFHCRAISPGFPNKRIFISNTCKQSTWRFLACAQLGPKTFQRCIVWWAFGSFYYYIIIVFLFGGFVYLHSLSLAGMVVCILWKNVNIDKSIGVRLLVRLHEVQYLSFDTCYFVVYLGQFQMLFSFLSYLHIYSSNRQIQQKVVFSNQTTGIYKIRKNLYPKAQIFIAIQSDIHQIDQYFDIQPFEDEINIISYNNYQDEVIHLQPYHSSTSNSSIPSNINVSQTINANNLDQNIFFQMNSLAKNENALGKDKSYKHSQNQRKYNVNKVIRCNYCKKMYSTISSLLFHIKNKHQTKQLQQYCLFTSIEDKAEQTIGQNQKQKSPKMQSFCVTQNLAPQSQLKQEIAKSIDKVKIQYNELPIFQPTQSASQRDPYSKSEIQIKIMQKKLQSQNSRRKNRSFISKRIYMCGGCFQFFHINQQLTIHLRADHKFEIPDGTIFGMKRQALFNYFKIQFKNQGIYLGNKSIQYRCECGKTYTCSSSLNFHIKNVHSWEPMAGTMNPANQKNNKIQINK